MMVKSSLVLLLLESSFPAILGVDGFESIP
ncbi:hypothetical protein Tco_0764445, partial [Tanacetum coccineum]